MGADALNREEKISVIVPVYRVESYLPRCLDSILAQSYSNLEVILVDDGSPDQSGEICDEYARRDKRIRVIHQINQGVSAARNAGLAVATGEWIGFVDGDDWIDPEMYEYLHELSKNYHSSLVQCGIFIEEQGNRIALYAPNRIYKVELTDNPSNKIFWEYFANSSCCKLFKRSMIAGLLFNTAFQIGEDALFNLNALSICRETVFGDKIYYHYWQDFSSASHTTVQNGHIANARIMFLHAENKFAKQKMIVGFCKRNRLRNNLDICSKIVCNHLEKSQHTLIEEIRNEMKGLCKDHFKGTDFTTKEKVKSYFIGYAWSVYKCVLPKWKTVFGKSAF